MQFLPMHTAVLARALSCGFVPSSPAAAELARIGLLKRAGSAFRPRARAVPFIKTSDAEDLAAWFVGKYDGNLTRFKQLGFLNARGGVTEWGYNVQATIELQEADLSALGDLVFGGSISQVGHHRLARLGLITPQAPHTNIGLDHLTSYGAALLIAQANHVG